MNKPKELINSNGDTYGRLHGYIKRDKDAFINELRAKGHKLSGRESIKRILELILNKTK